MRAARPYLSIRWKMTLFYTGLLATLLVAFGLFLFFSVERLMIESLHQALVARFEQAMSAAPTIVEQLQSTPPTASNTQVPVLETLAGPGVFLQIRGPYGSVIAASTNLHGQVLPAPTNVPGLKGQVQEDLVHLPVERLLPEAANTDIHVARFLVQSGLLTTARGQVVGLLQVAQSLFTVDEVQDHLVDQLLLGILGGLLIALVVGAVLAGRVLHPIAQITEVARRIGGSSDLSHRIELFPRPRQDEVGKLAATCNAMLDRLEHAFTVQRQFIGDAGHELKTPLTAILGHANLIRRRGQDHPELVNEATWAIIEQAERLHRLTSELLDLTRIEEQEIACDVVSLGQIALEVVRELTPLAQGKVLSLQDTSLKGTATLLRGDRDKLKQLMVNLVDNALEATPAGGYVWVEARPEAPDHPQRVLLIIQDTGCGIEAHDLPHIFERFYRVDKARSRATGGNGLGLAIVQEIVRRHDGQMEVESKPGAGTRFHITFPAFSGFSSGEGSKEEFDTSG